MLRAQGLRFVVVALSGSRHCWPYFQNMSRVLSPSPPPLPSWSKPSLLVWIILTASSVVSLLQPLPSTVYYPQWRIMSPSKWLLPHNKNPGLHVAYRSCSVTSGLIFSTFPSSLHYLLQLPSITCSLLFLRDTKHAPTSGLLHSLSPFPEQSSSRYSFS